jgi:predicted O-methyltransferase YrrM
MGKVNMSNILTEMYNKIDKSDTGFTLHYPFLYSLVLGLESKNVFEFGTGFSTHCILHALEKTSGRLTSCDVTHFNENPNVTEFTRKNKRWTFHHGDTNTIFNSIEHDYYDLILHDGSHIGTEVLIDLNNIYPYLKHDGILIMHDTRHPSLGPDMMSAFENFKKDKDLEYLSLPYGYGLTFFRNKGNKENKINLTWKKQ